MYSSEIFSKDYSVYRKDTINHGGGAFILVNKSIPSSNLEIESSCVKLFGLFYTFKVLTTLSQGHGILPKSTPFVWEHLSECLIQRRQRFPAMMIIQGGDFKSGLGFWFISGLFGAKMLCVSRCFIILLVSICSNTFLQSVDVSDILVSSLLGWIFYLI